jgi:hypothetical protein
MIHTDKGFFQSFYKQQRKRILNELAYSLQLSSEYERNVGNLIIEKNQKLEELKKNQRVSAVDLQKLQEEIETLRSLFENYNLGMNYFRRARGGRSGLRE